MLLTLTISAHPCHKADMHLRAPPMHLHHSCMFLIYFFIHLLHIHLKYKFYYFHSLLNVTSVRHFHTRVSVIADKNLQLIGKGL